MASHEWRDSFLESREWRTVRMRALEKHGAKCQCCGRTATDGIVINVDHIKPRATHPELALTESNLQILCNECNHGKGNWSERDWRPPSAAPAALSQDEIETAMFSLWVAIVRDPETARTPFVVQFAAPSWAHSDDQALAVFIDSICECAVTPTSDDVVARWSDTKYGEPLSRMVAAARKADLPLSAHDILLAFEGKLNAILERSGPRP